MLDFIKLCSNMAITINNDMIARFMPIISQLESYTLTKAKCLEEL